MRLKKKHLLLITLASATLLYVASGSYFSHPPKIESILTELSAPRSYAIDVHTVGELEAMRSTSIASTINGDLGKIIYLIADGVSVLANEILVRIDPTPFEENVDNLQRLIREQHSKIHMLESINLWEQQQGEHEEKAARIEIEAAKLEINKLVHGDGPIEEARLRAAMQKCAAKYRELRSFKDDLVNLEAEGFLNAIELKQAEDKLIEEQENFESARMQYDSYITHTQPMQIKKAEIALKRCKNKFEEIIKSSAFRNAKLTAQREQLHQELEDLQNRLKNAEHQMTLTEIKAPTPGMVVLKAEFRSGQRRKPRLGDILLKNQPILDLPDLETILVKTKVREIDLFKIQIGTQATVEVDAYPELQFQGAISSIGVLALSEATNAGNEKYFDVIVKLDSSDLRLRPGMTARVVLHASRVDNKLSIPIQAVYEFNKRFYCFIKMDNGCRGIQIETGKSNEQWIEITAGLKENALVLLSAPPWTDVENREEMIGSASPSSQERSGQTNRAALN